MRADTSRRGVLAGGSAMAALALLPAGGCSTAPPFPGTLGGPDLARGHRLRDRQYPAASGAEQRAGIVIAGGGVAGLAAGWALAEAGFTDFALLELEDETGGNARSGRNAVSAYPLGAHYLPIPNRESSALRHMLGQFGMITGQDDSGAPRYDPLQLCADLEERLLWRGKWQEGLYPASGLSGEDERQRDRFLADMARFRDARGQDGRPAFAVPSALSSRDPTFAALDQQSFAQWLAATGYTSPALLAHVRYACRDDYGTEPDQVSALARVVAGLPALRLRGLMAIPRPLADPIAQQAQFAQVRALFERLQAEGLALDTLSMGMSDDLEAAVAQGATIVRVGSALFGRRTAAAPKADSAPPLQVDTTT